MYSRDGFIELTTSPLSNFVSKKKYTSKNTIGEYIYEKNYGFLDIYWNPTFTKIEKIIGGFNSLSNNNPKTVVEIK